MEPKGLDMGDRQEAEAAFRTGRETIDVGFAP